MERCSAAGAGTGGPACRGTRVAGTGACAGARARFGWPGRLMSLGLAAGPAQRHLSLDRREQAPPRRGVLPGAGGQDGRLESAHERPDAPASLSAVPVPVPVPRPSRTVSIRRTRLPFAERRSPTRGAHHRPDHPAFWRATEPALRDRYPTIGESAKRSNQAARRQATVLDPPVLASRLALGRPPRGIRPRARIAGADVHSPALSSGFGSPRPVVISRFRLPLT